jgi:hypothetical protein
MPARVETTKTAANQIMVLATTSIGPGCSFKLSKSNPNLG